MADQFDVVVIGAGPGGYIAAIRAAQLGFRTACIDDWTRAGDKPAPGGTCTNVGCIPSKALLQSSENFEHAGHAFADHGIMLDNLGIDVARMQARKEKVVAQNNDGILFLFRKNKVTFFHGRGVVRGRQRRRRVDGEGRRRDAGRAHGDARHRRDRVEAASAARDGHRQRARARQRGRAGAAGGAEDARRGRRGRHRPRDGQCVAAARCEGDGAGGAAGLPWRRRRSDREGGEEALREAGTRHSSRRLDHEGDGGEERRHGRVERRRGRGPVGRVRPADRVDRPRSAHRADLAPKRSDSSSTSAASSRSTPNAGPTSPMSGRSATSSAVRCSRTRPRRRASRSPSGSPDSTDTSTSTPCRG